MQIVAIWMKRFRREVDIPWVAAWMGGIEVKERRMRERSDFMIASFADRRGLKKKMTRWITIPRRLHG
jgi:hypothetical protein